MNPPSLPPELIARLETLAHQLGRSVDSLVLEAVERYAAYEERMRDLVQTALNAGATLDTVSQTYGSEDVHSWMKSLRGDSLT